MERATNYSSIITQETKLTASDGERNDVFGVIVDVEDNLAVIGARADDDNGRESGSAYVFEKVDGEWVETTKLTASDGDAGDLFGDSLALGGDIIVVGAWEDEDLGSGSGSAYVFEKVDGEWVETAKLLASDGTEEDFFGISPGVVDNTIVVAAPGDEHDTGAVYVFEKVEGEWVETTKIAARDGSRGDAFGRFLSVQDDKMIVGAMGDDTHGNNSGAAYIFEKIDGVWTETAKLTASDGTDHNLFGRQARIDGDRVIIGAYKNENKGAAYIFEKIDGVWTETAKLTASDGADKDSFGRSVYIQDHIAVVGARADDDNGDESGSVYIFEQIDGEWIEIEKITASDGGEGDRFGRRVFLDGNNLFVGATKNNLVGAAYVYELDINRPSQEPVVEDVTPSQPEVDEPVVDSEPEASEPVVEDVTPSQPEVDEPVVDSEPEASEPVVEDVTPSQPEVDEPVVDSEPEASEPVVEDVISPQPELNESSEQSSLDAPLPNIFVDELIDLTDLEGQQVRAEFDVESNAAYDNLGGLYIVTDEQGTVLDPLTGQQITPGEQGYSEAALRNSVVEFDREGIDPQILFGGFLLAPYLLADGEEAFFAFEEANSDGVDHINRLGNQFNFEDLLGGGDFSYDDFSFAVDVETLV